MKNSEFRTGRHVVYLLHAHLVFVTKKRGKVLTKEYLKALHTIFHSVCEACEAQLIEFNGEADHVHLLVNYPPKLRLSELVNSLKGVSSRQLKLKFPEVERFWSVRLSKNALWSPSYFAGSCGGAPIDVLRKYIENQGN